MKKRHAYVVEIKRAIRDFMNNIDIMSSNGELNSDGVKAIARILKLLNRSGMGSETERLKKSLKKKEDVGVITSLLLQLEERLS
jgi:intergrase/recombinase